MLKARLGKAKHAKLRGEDGLLFIFGTLFSPLESLEERNISHKSPLKLKVVLAPQRTKTPVVPTCTYMPFSRDARLVGLCRHARKLCKQHYDDSADVEIIVESGVNSSFELELLGM